VKWKLEIEMKLLGKNGIRIEIEFFFRMEITLVLCGHISMPCKRKNELNQTEWNGTELNLR